ncbi:unnamed protein product [Trifolium pratense]|uniref:Uncharacterized protein n=2 Tax=Trifolium pratense TaxID=57577 RepID=A0ACB0IWQ6_TRIPR|nr:unnamed protein product [Trifolium pratense]CAJ2648094.1 unnamed protein product [Trifolium pratense]
MCQVQVSPLVLVHQHQGSLECNKTCILNSIFARNLTFTQHASIHTGLCIDTRTQNFTKPQFQQYASMHIVPESIHEPSFAKTQFSTCIGSWGTLHRFIYA